MGSLVFRLGRSNGQRHDSRTRRARPVAGVVWSYSIGRWLMMDERTRIRGAEVALSHLGTARESGFHLIFGHGWGHSGAAFRPLAETLNAIAPSTLIDFPGFGASAPPPEVWGTAEYADATAEWLSTLAPARLIWVGHSFGSRVGIQI